MRISGLSNQWKSRDGFLDSLAIDPDADAFIAERNSALNQFLLHLETLDGADIWVSDLGFGTLGFYNRDVRSDNYLTVEAVQTQDCPTVFCYRVGFSLTGGHWEYHDIKSVAEAAEMICRLV